MQGDVRVDDNYLVGKRTGGVPGRGSSNKVAFVAAVELRDGRPPRGRFDPVAGFSFAALAPWAKRYRTWQLRLTDGLLGPKCSKTCVTRTRRCLLRTGKRGSEIEPFKWLSCWET